MTDPDLDRALADALNAEPRPDFLARVRAEVASQPAPAGWPGWWRAVAAGAAVAVLVAAGSLWETSERSAPAAREAARREAFQGTSSAPARPAVGGDTRSSTPAVVRAAARRSAPARSGVTAPRDQADPAGAEMLRLAIEAARDGVLAGGEASPEPLAVSRIDLEPLSVEPLAAIAPIETGERQ